ncbi:PQQ-binding-like beta-propeller repeat protein [Paludisphaera sp.]|uniref:outer membrane protein assembly factor BamB family protein n=1 Tax=Paludisphaera sp. TaxID=2017432 RepID=UPI00301DAE0C
MSRRLALLWAPLLLCWAGPTAFAQSQASSVAVPSRAALARLGLERQWVTVAPVGGSERVLRISRGQDYLFVQTNQGFIHAYDVETGRPVWSAQVGEHSSNAMPISQNSYAVFASSANVLTALDRHTGRTIWRHGLGSSPTSGTTADDDHVVVGMGTGMLRCFDLREEEGDRPVKIRSTPKLSWNLATGGAVRTRPLFGDRIVCFGSDDGRTYVSLKNEPTNLYRVSTGGPIGAELASHGTRSLLIPSADFNLYSVDVLTAKIQWVFPSGAPISQGPIVAQDSIFVINDRGDLSVLDPTSGEAKWTTATDHGKFLGVSPTKVYLLSPDNDLVVVARDSGKVLLDPAATFRRAGLDLREFTLSFPERFDDRLFLATQSGVILGLREVGATTPQPLQPPSDKPFGYVPPEGITEIHNPFEAAPADTDPDAEPDDMTQRPF